MFRRRAPDPAPANIRSVEPALWMPAQYQGQRAVRVAATQLDDQIASPAERRGILRDWIVFLSAAETNIDELRFVSRVPQELLDAAAGQTRIHTLDVKWGPYRDLSVLTRLSALNDLALGGAVGVESLEPLTQFPALTCLLISQAHRATDLEPLSRLVGLQSLTFGNSSLGSDRSLVLPDLRWISPLAELRTLRLPGTRILDPDLSPILKLPNLETLVLPLRRSYRKQVFALATSSDIFARVADDYEQYDAYVASNRTGR